MNFDEIVYRISGKKSINYLKKYCIGAYSMAIKVIESVKDENIESIVNNSDVISSIVILPLGNKFYCCFQSKFRNEVYKFKVSTANFRCEDFPYKMEMNDFHCVTIYLDTMEIEYSIEGELEDYLSKEKIYSNCVKKLEEIFGNLLVRYSSADSRLILKMDFFMQK